MLDEDAIQAPATYMGLCGSGPGAMRQFRAGGNPLHRAAAVAGKDLRLDIGLKPVHSCSTSSTRWRFMSIMNGTNAEGLETEVISVPGAGKPWASPVGAAGER